MIGGLLYAELRFNPFPIRNQFVNIVVMANGSVRQLSPDISEVTLRAITRNDGNRWGRTGDELADRGGVAGRHIFAAIAGHVGFPRYLDLEKNRQSF